MPPKPSWLRRIPQIRAALEALDEAFLDRAAIQGLFGVSRRRAVTLAHTIGSRELGHSLVVPRNELLLFLRDRQLGKAREIENTRRRRVRDVLADAQRDLAARRVKIAVSPTLAAQTLRNLPPTITLRPGELRISFAGAEDLLQQLYTLSRAVAQDYPAFEAAIASPR